MANINKITVDGVSYNITIPSGLTDAEQAQVRQNIGAISAADADVVRDGTYPEMTVGEAVHAQNADAAAQADKLSAPRAIDGVSFDGTASINHGGTCSTPAGTAEKTVAIESFVLVPWARITVNFSTANTVSQPTLNVNGTGAKGIRCKGRSTDIVWKAEIMTLIYDGTYWQIISGYSLADKPVGTHLPQHKGENTPAALYGGTWAVDTDYAGRVSVYYGTATNLLYKGSYNSATQYNANEIVTYSGSFYMAIQATQGNLPTNTTYWTEYKNGAKGGEATHTQTIEELVSHHHDHLTDDDSSGSWVGRGNGTGVPGVKVTAEQVSNIGGLMRTNFTGNGKPFNIMQPYIIETMWKRTA